MPANEFSNAGIGNVVYKNNFVDNTKNVLVNKSYLASNDTALSGITAQVSWDNAVTGNFWSDYNGSGFYVIDQNNVDHHPLSQPLDNSTDMSTPNLALIIIAALIALIILAFLVYRRYRKTMPETSWPEK